MSLSQIRVPIPEAEDFSYKFIFKRLLNRAYFKNLAI